MRRCRRVRDETLRIPQIVRNVDQPKGVEKAKTALLVASDVEAHETAAPFHLFARKIVLGMARQAGVKHPGDLWVGLEVAGHCRSGAALPLDAEIERFKPLQ